MRKLEIILLAFLISSLSALPTIVWGQSLMLENATLVGYKGVKKMGNDGYFVQFVESVKYLKKEKKLRLVMINNNLETVGEFRITIMPSEEVEDVGYNGGNFMIVTKHKRKRYRVFRIMDKAGKELASKTFEKVKARFLKKDLSIIPVDFSDFLVLNYVKEDQIGYSLERYTDKLELKYTEMNVPDKKMLYPVDFKIAGNILFVMENMSQGTDYFQYSITGFDIEKGKKLFRKVLDDEEANVNGLATFLRISPKGNAVTGGMYFNGNRIQEANSDGFFGAVIDREGNMRIGHRDWKDVKKRIEDEGLGAMWGGKTKTLLQDVVVFEDGTFSIIGENFRRGDADLAGDGSKVMGSMTKLGKMNSNNDEPKEVAMTVEDFIFFDFNIDSKFQDLRHVKKPATVTLIKASAVEGEQPDRKIFKGLNLANILNNYGYFPYRFTVNKEGQKYIAYYYRRDSQGEETLYFTNLKTGEQQGGPIDITSYKVKLAHEFMGSMLGGAFGALAKASKSTGGSSDNEFVVTNKHDGGDNRAKLINSRIFPSNLEGKIVCWDFEPPKEDLEDEKAKKGWIQQFNAASNGNFKIWYIDIP